MPNPKKRAEKQEAASTKKNAAESAKKAAQEEAEWQKGAKGSSKAEKEAEKKAEQQRKKEEKLRLEAEENAKLPSKPSKVIKGAEKAAAKKTSKVDQFVPSTTGEGPSALSASNIEDALDALTITNKSTTTASAVRDIDRHPEKRFKAAFAVFEARRVQEMKEEKSGLRLQQMKEVAYKEFQKSPENPFNQLVAEHNATKSELVEIAVAERKKQEERLQR